MTTLGIVDGGQGDCFILRPSPCALRPGKCWSCTSNCWSGFQSCCFCPEECQYRHATFMIDLGDGSVDITRHLGADDTLHLILTQSHRDYSKSLAQFLPAITKPNSLPAIQSVTLPHNQNEIIFIAEAIANTIGVEYIAPSNPDIIYLKGLTSWQKILKRTFDTHPVDYTSSMVHWGYDGYRPCNHILYQNPTLSFSNQEDSAALTEKLEAVSLLFNAGFSGQFSDYFKIFTNKTLLQKMRYNPEGFSFTDTLPPFVIEHFIVGNMDNQFLYNFVPLHKEKACFVLNFFYENLLLFQEFSAEPTTAKLSAIITQLKQISAQNSLVLRYDNDYEKDYATDRRKNFLFTSDVDEVVLSRIVASETPPACYYLKVPTHCTQKSLSKEILEKLNPVVAILPHCNQNRAQQDSFPSQEVMTLLEKENIQLITTNEIVKNGKIIHFVYDNYFDDSIRILPQ